MKKKLWIGLSVLLLLACSGCGLLYEKSSFSPQAIVFGNQKLVCIDDWQEMIFFVQEHLEEGAEEIVFYTNELELKELQKINEELDGYYGLISQCQTEKYPFATKTKIKLSCEISDEFYARRYLMEGVAIPEDRPKAEELVEACEKLQNKMNKELGKKADDYDKEQWIHDYLVLKTAYGYIDGQPEEENDAHYSYGALIEHQAVCNGYAFAMKLLCDINDIECKVIIGDGDGQPHAWNMVRLNEEWYHVDTTWDDPSPDTKGRVLYTYFNINDERAALSHSWKEEYYPQADELEDNYYVKNHLYCKDYPSFKKKCIEIMKKDHPSKFQVMVGDYEEETYHNKQMDFIFEHTDSHTFSYQNIGDIPYMTIYIQLSD